MDQLRNFNNDFEHAITILKENSNLAVFEEITKNHVLSNSNYKVPIYLNYQIQLFDEFADCAPVLLYFLKSNISPSYSGPNKVVFRRLLNLKKIVGSYFRTIESIMADPNHLKTTLFKIEENKRTFQMSLFTNDNKYLDVNLDINSSINLITQLMENISSKLDDKTNNIIIDKQIRDNLDIKYNIITEKLENVITNKKQDA